MRCEMHDAVSGQLATLAHSLDLMLAGMGAQIDVADIAGNRAELIAVFGSGICLRICKTSARPLRI
jgi:hypothetical protein